MYFFYYYPLGVDVPVARRPWATIGLGLICLGLFLAPLWYPPARSWIGQYAYRPAQADFLTPLAAVFFHAGWMHLAGNLIYLIAFGPALERALGPLGLLVLFAGTGYLGNLTQGATTMHLTPENAWGGVVGASGAVSGALGLFLVRFYYARIRIGYWAFLPLQGINRTGRVHLPGVFGVAMWFALQITWALVQGKGAGTAYGAHLGGFASGILLALVLGQRGRAKLECIRARAERARESGNFHEAIGELQRYLEQVQWDEGAWLELARNCIAAREWGRAQAIYRELMMRHLEDGDLPRATEIYLEARRGNSVFALPVAEMRRIAFWLEKSTRFADAAACYLDMARVYPEDAGREHALARAATLLHTRLGNDEQALDVIDEALSDFPDGEWQGFLSNQRARIERQLRYGWMSS